MREKLVPAFTEGQSAIVIDAKTTSMQWHIVMPESRIPLPMIGPGFVVGVNDANLARQGFSELFAIAQLALDSAGKLVPEDNPIPFEEIPPPKKRDIADGTVYYYELPAEADVDGTKIAPNAGLSRDFLATTLMPDLPRRLLARNPLQLDGPLAQIDWPLASAA